MRVIPPVQIVDNGAYSRASVATYFDRLGLLRTAPVNQPRLNYPPLDLTPVPTAARWRAGASLLLPAAAPEGVTEPAAPGGAEYLAEAAARNLLIQSEDISGYTLVAATVATNASTAPDGTLTADRLVPDATDTAWHGGGRLASETVATGAVVGASVFLRSAGFGRAILRCAPDGEAAGVQMTVDLTDGEIVDATSFGAGAVLVDARLYGLPGGWYRLALRGSVAGVSTYGLSVYVGDGTSFVGDEAAGVDVWGHQIEGGAVTSYIKTGATPATRAADVGVPMLVSSVPEDEPLFVSGSSYGEGEIRRGDGARAHQLFISAVAANTAPLSDATKWLAAGASNRWKMVDQATSSQTTAAEDVTVVINPGEIVDTLAVLNVDAAELTVTMRHPTEGVVFDETVSLVSDSGIDNYYDWFFTPIERVGDKEVTLPPYADAQVVVTLSDPGATVRVGDCVVGRSVDIGDTQFGLGLRLVSYSNVTTNQLGDTDLVKRRSNRLMRAVLIIPAGDVGRVYRLLAELDAVPILWIGDDAYEVTMVKGIYRDFDVAIEESDVSFCNLEVLGIFAR